MTEAAAEGASRGWWPPSRKRRPRRSGIARREARNGLAFISPWLVGCALFTLGPFIIGLLLGFTDYNGINPPEWVGLSNYSDLFSDPKFSKSIENTAVFVALCVPLTVVLGLLIAILLNQRVRGQAFFRTAAFLPAVLPLIPSLLLLAWVLNDQYGLLNIGLGEVGVDGPAWLTDPSWTKPALALWILWQVGATSIIYLAGLQNLPSDLYEAAELDGASKIKQFWRITVPMLSPTIFFVLTYSIIVNIQGFAAAIFLGGSVQFTSGAGPLDSLLLWVVYIYQQGFFFLRLGYASAIACILFVVVMLITLVQFVLARRWVYYES